MAPWLQSTITVVCSVFACSGFWAFLQSRETKKSCHMKLLLGLAHDRIIYLGLKYIERGDWITQDEFENLHDYLYLPYEESGGNGSAKRVMDEVKKLRVVPSNYKLKEVPGL